MKTTTIAALRVLFEGRPHKVLAQCNVSYTLLAEDDTIHIVQKSHCKTFHSVERYSVNRPRKRINKRALEAKREILVTGGQTLVNFSNNIAEAIKQFRLCK